MGKEITPRSSPASRGGGWELRYPRKASGRTDDRRGRIEPPRHQGRHVTLERSPRVRGWEWGNRQDSGTPRPEPSSHPLPRPDCRGGRSGRSRRCAARIMSGRSGRPDNPDEEKGGARSPVLAFPCLGGLRTPTPRARRGRQGVSWRPWGRGGSTTSPSTNRRDYRRPFVGIPQRSGGGGARQRVFRRKDPPGGVATD